MIPNRPASLAITFSFALVCAVATAAETFFVDPNGNDSWSGRLNAPSSDGKDGPLATLTGARNAIRRLKAAGPLREPVRVTIRAGTYRITEPFVLEPQDSGTKDAPITYAGESGARPVVSGGRPITGWRREGKLWIADIPDVKSGAWSFGALWVNGARRVRARTPNEGWLFTEGKDPARPSTAFRFKAGDISKWRNVDDACVVVYHSWETSLHRILSIDETESTVVFTGPAAWAFESWGPRQRYHVENVSEALDAPGEWYLDRRTGVLSYMPLDGEDIGGEDIAKVDAIAPVAKQLVVLAGDPASRRFVEHVSFEGLRFLHTDWTLPEKGHSDSQAAASIEGAVEAVGARHCSLTRCEVGGVATYGVWLRAGCQDCRVAECEVHDLGAGGVRIGETSSPATDADAAERNTIENCFVHDGGKIFRSGVGVWIGRSSHNRIAHCEVCDFDYSGFSVGWSWGYAESSAHDNVIEWNHIHEIGRGVLNDLGAIYTLGISPGTVERFNSMHDIYCHSFGGWGVYTDEGSTGIVIEKNIVYNTSSGCFHQHYGKENILRNNVFAFGIEGVLRRSREEDHTSFIFERNIVLSHGTRFHIAEWSNGHYTIDSNVYWDYEDPEPLFAGMAFADWRAKGRDTKSILADPLCEDPERFDFRLKPGSPAASIGIEPFELSQAGLQGDAEWTSLSKKVKRVAYRPPSPPPPEPIADDFEETAVGSQARGAVTTGETEAARIRVTDEAAVSGKRSLKFIDAPGLDHRFNPHLYYTPSFRKGVLEERFSLRVEQGAVFFHEWRDAASPYRVGPSCRVEADGRLLAGGRELLRIPHGKWIDVEISCGLGGESSGKWDLAVKLLDADAPRRFDALPCDAKLRELRWLGFVADADAAAVFYIDRLSLKPRDAHASRVGPTEIHVASSGSDDNAGTSEKPFASLERARDAIRELKKAGSLPSGGVTVWIEGGDYVRTRSFELTEADSGMAGAPIVYRAREGTVARLLGGKSISGFHPVSDADLLSRLAAEARGKVLEADLASQGITDFGKLRSRGFGRPSSPAHLELFFGGKPMTLARWPNVGFTRISSVGEAEPTGDGHGGKIGKLEGGFVYEGDRPHAWKSVDGVWVHGYWAWDWANSYEEVASIDLGRRLITTKSPHGLYGFRSGQRFYFLNVLEELDAPGEYFVDARRGKLYFWPPSPVEGSEALVSVLEEPLVEMKGASHVTIRGLTLEDSRGVGARIVSGDADRISGCTLRNLGGYAVTVDGGTGHGVEDCDISETGDGGVQLEGGDRKTLAPSRHFASGNHVHHIARWSKCYCPAFLLGGVGSIISGNLIHDHPHCAILFNGNEHVIERNEIHHVCLETGDVGAIYTGRDWTYRGNIIRHNFIHETGGVGMGSMGVYLDDCVSGEKVIGNVFWKVQRAAFIGGGRDNQVMNNVFVECDPAVSIDGRGLDRSPVWRDMVEKTMKQSLDAMHHHEPPYSERYPELCQLDAIYAKGEGVPPGGNLVAHNVCAGGKWLQVGWHANAEMSDVRDNLVSEDPRFVDAAHGNFQLRDDSPAWKLGFERIPLEQIGLHRDVSAAPVVEAEEEVARCSPPKNGAGPLWCYGAPLVVRRRGEVFVSAAETGEGVPPLANMRPRVFRRPDKGPWELAWQPDGFREREPCPIAGLADGSLFLSVNTSTTPPGTWYGASDPHVLVFKGSIGFRAPIVERPPWAAGASFTDHSYRGIAADARRGELLVLDIDAKTSEQHWSLRAADGEWRRSGRIAFPIRACYPQVALRDGAAHVLAVGDIVEPVEEWRRFKHEKTGSEWDYVFRRLFYAWSPNLEKDGFRASVEVESLDPTAGHIRNLDLWIDAAGAAHVLYLRQTVQSAMMRDRFFRGTPLVTSLELALLENGAVVRRETLLAGGEGREGLLPGNARLHSTDGARLFAVVFVSGMEAGKSVSEDRIFQILPERGPAMTIPLREPFSTFFTNCERGGSEPSRVLDLFGAGANDEVLRHARVRL